MAVSRSTVTVVKTEICVSDLFIDLHPVHIVDLDTPINVCQQFGCYKVRFSVLKVCGIHPFRLFAMERRLGQNSSFLFDSKPQSMENNHCNNDVDHLRSIAFSLRSNAIVVTSTSTKID